MSLRPEEAQAAERAAYAAVDDALRSFPMRPAPPGLAPSVMAALRAPERVRAEQPTFGLSWIDFALSGFAALMLAMVLWLSGWLTPEAAARLQALVAAPILQTNVLVWRVAGGALVLTAGLLLLAGLVFRRPGPIQRF
jgi:hypothetical protein